MIVRARAGEAVRVPAAGGSYAELRIQDRFLPVAVPSGGTAAVWTAEATSGLHWGRRSLLRGEVWIGKERHDLEVAR